MKATIRQNKAIFISTLGSEPQVVSATLDLLTRKGVHPGKSIVFYTDAPAISRAVAVLAAELGRGAAGMPVEFVALQDSAGAVLTDIDTPDSVLSAFRAVYQVIRREKQAGHLIHLSISGGRKPLSIFGMVAAQMLFDESDCLWYLISSGEFLESKRFHPQAGDRAALVQIPVILWSSVSPMMSGLLSVDDPFQALDQIRRMRLNDKIDDARAFVLGSLTPAEQRVVEILVRDGSGDQAIAERLSLSARTVEQHLRSAYGKASDHWELAEINRSQLITLLQLYYSTRLREIPDDNRGRNR